MASRERLPTPRVNFFSGQRVTEADLDAEQIHNLTVAAETVKDFHGSGVVRETPFENTILLDTRFPGNYTTGSSENPSKLDIEGGSYDGLGISLDRQPPDTTRGTRLEFSLVNANVLGRNRVKIMVLGRAFDGLDSSGALVAEFIEFGKNSSKLSQYYYQEVIAIHFNNFSGGTGRTSSLASVDSLDLITDTGGYMIVKEAEPLAVFPATRMAYQIESPNHDMANFITSTPTRTIQEEIEVSLGSTNSLSDLYIDLDGKAQVSFPKDGNTTIAYGQKFLAKTDNIQKIDLLLSVSRDDSQPSGNEFDFSGDLILSIHELATETDCPTDAVPENLIDFDPEITPLVEISFGQEDLETLGYSLSDDPQVVSFNFAGTLIADPNIEPSIIPDRFYAIVLKRSGDNRTGTIIVEKGFDKVAGKVDAGVDLTTVERFSKQETKYIEFDPNTKRYITDSESSLWFVIHSDAVEVVDGTAYTDSGVAITIPKTKNFVGETEISNFVRNISLATVSEGAANYAVLSHVDEFTSPGVHPRTGNFVFTRILDSAAVSIVDQSGLNTLLEDTTPLLLARINDKNVRDAQSITGTFNKPGLIDVDRIIIENPSNELFNSNLLNRIIIPDTACECNAMYRIAGIECILAKAGDLDGDGKLTSVDISELINIVGNTINSEATERSILGGQIEVMDFIKADLNNDETIDGTDIELLEDAIDGYVNFTINEEIKFLILKLENILSSNDNPVIFVDTANTGVTTAADNELTFTTLTDNQALTIRPGDVVEIPLSSVDSGTYLVVTKLIASDGLSVTLTVSNTDGTDVVFTGSSGFNVTIISGTAVNTYADNPNLTDIPFSTTSYEISFVESPFEEKFVEVCDLRRFVGISFIEEGGTDPCECAEDECLPASDCEPEFKNQLYVPGDIYIPNGELLEAPGVPYHGDFEYANITIPLPPGTITDCSIDLYNTFIKGEDGSCKTAAGFNAMKYSDGTVVGCQDSGSNTDITKGRVKFSHAICSLFVDALIGDGYQDGYSDATATGSVVENISEEFVDFTYTAFNEWVENAGNNTAITNTSHSSGTNQPAVFDLLTSSDSGERFGRLDAPSEAQDFEDDFIIDFTASRTVWSTSALTNGTVSSFATVVISNDDGSTATLKLGWKVTGANPTKLFYSGVIKNSSNVVVSTFDYTIDSPDTLGDDVLFRLRRVSDVVSAYYIIPDKIDDSGIDEAFGQYIRIGSNPEMHPGSGTATFSFEIAQNNAPTPGLSFFTKLSKVAILSEYESTDEPASLVLSRSASTNKASRATVTFPLGLNRRTSVVSARLELQAAETGTFTDPINVIPLDILNADNLGPLYNIPRTQDSSMIVSFTPGTVTAGETIEVDITDQIIVMLATQGHLPGFIRAFILEPSLSADSSFTIATSSSLVIEYEDATTGIVYKIGVSLDKDTGLVTLNTRNILFDSLIEENRTLLNFGVYLKKAGFINQDIEVSIQDLARIGIGTCEDEGAFDENEECFLISANTGTGVFIQGPFPCQFVSS